MAYTESDYEKAIIEYFQNKLGYDHLYAPDLRRDYSEPLYLDAIRPALRRVNPDLPEAALNEALSRLRNLGGDTYLQKNILFMDYLRNGISVNYFDRREQRSALVHLIDYENINRNTFLIANQWTLVENSERRLDLIVFVNGLPLVTFELKSPSREETDASKAYLQLRNYMQEIPSLFAYNAFLVMSDLLISKAGTITAGEDRFMEWKTKDGSYENTEYAQFDTFLEGIFEKDRFLDIIRNFICFSGDVKILSAYHQYYAVRKAIESTIKATQTDGRGGVFWHTQGSGKSLSMIFYARLLQDYLKTPTILVLTDRNDLDNQLFEEFAKCSNFLRQQPQQAESRAHLRELLEGRKAHGILFATAQKFEEIKDSECLSDRNDIIVIADEAHRSQFIDQYVAAKTGRVKKTFGLIIRESLPKATYIGFTGTPISQKDRSTIEVFGNYIDIYDMTQAVDDQATRPVYYESRVIHLNLDQGVLKEIDAEYEVLAAQAEGYAIEKSKRELSKLEAILGAEQTIDALCRDIVEHYEENRQHVLTGKAMIVSYSRAIAMSIYRKLMELRPNWTDLVRVVMTEGNADPEDWRKVIGNKGHRDELARLFKDDDSPMKIAIVVDMWLTGFDVPSLATMYVYKPMSGHNLMQAIARVNRVYKDKEGGLVVDYIGIASALKEAMNDYTVRDRRNYGDTDIAKTAYPKFLEKLEVCRDLFFGFDYSDFMREDATDLIRAQAISGGVNFLMAVEKTSERLFDRVSYTLPKVADQPIGYGDDSSRKELFIREATLLRQAVSLCRSLLNPRERYVAAYFDAVRTLLTRIVGPGKSLSLREINARISELLKQSIKSEGVINLFSDIEEDYSIFSEGFLEEIARMKERNLVVELLKKLLDDQVSLYRRTNLVKSELFSEKLNRAMKSYINGMITNEQVIEELLKMAKEMANAQEEGDEMGLTSEELAFYDALTRPEAIKDFYDNQVLIEMAVELTDALRKNRTIDWHKKESARAGMRRLVKKLLKKYKYPPESIPDAINTVIGQCEMWTDCEVA